MTSVSHEEVRKLLDRLVAAQSLSNDEAEVIGDDVLEAARNLPRDGIVPIIDKAVGRSKRRRNMSIYLLGQLTDVPEAVARIGQMLDDPDSEVRSWAIQSVGMAALAEHAEALNRIMREDPDEYVRCDAVHAAAGMKHPVNLPTLLSLADRKQGPAIGPAVLWALTHYAQPDCRPYLAAVFKRRGGDAGDRVVAAWGLAKLGDAKAHEYLEAMLDDPDSEAGIWAKLKHKFVGEPLVAFAPGQSMRAAQALCDINGWPFEWGEEVFSEDTESPRDYYYRMKAANGPAGTCP